MHPLPPNSSLDTVQSLVESLTFKQKVDRSLELVDRAVRAHGDALVVANSLGKDSVAVWHLVRTVRPDVRGFIVTTRFKPAETVRFMRETIQRYPELLVFQNDATIDADLWRTEPDRCCQVLKVEPTRRAIEQMRVRCWVTGLRCTEGRTRTGFGEVEQRDEGLVKLNPILLWKEREVWQYLALHGIPVNPLYAQGYRSLGCAPCTQISTDDNERAGRWVGSSKCGGECGIHTQPLRDVTKPGRAGASR